MKFLFICFCCVLSNIEIVNPPELRDALKEKNKSEGLKYSVSTFGDILFNQKAMV